MKFKNISTALLLIAASALLLTLALKVRTGGTADTADSKFSAARGCCGNKGGCCASNRQNQNKGELK